MYKLVILKPSNKNMCDNFKSIIEYNYLRIYL